MRRQINSMSRTMSRNLGAFLSALVATTVATTSQAEVVSPLLRDSLTFVPPHVAGDAEFNGNGPSVNVKVRFTVNDNTLLYSVYFKAKETKSDWTEASGWSPARTVYTAPAGMRIVSVPKSEYELVIDTMSGHNPKTFVSPLGRVTIWGDQRGQDAGVYTKLQLDLDATIPIDVAMSDAKPEQAVYLPRTFTCLPPHTRGDKDFNGNGPRVVVDASIEHDSQTVHFVVKMIAEETKHDSTTAAGFAKTQIYAAPAGRRIVSVGGETSWPGLVSYYDSNHSIDKFETDLGPVSVFGDHAGDDAGTYTKVVLGDINRFVVVRTAPSNSFAGPEMQSSGRGNSKESTSMGRRNSKRRR